MPIKPAPSPKHVKNSSPSVKAVTSPRTTSAFYADDFFRTLFPLKTNLFLIENGEMEIRDYIKRCLDESDKQASFLPQLRVFAAKPNLHLRRTVKLDVVTEFYVYDLVFRNRNLFKKSHAHNRQHYGYRFQDGSPISATEAYKGFKGAIAEYSKKFSHSLSFDIASYFNGLYHHDLASWFRELGVESDDAEGFGQMLREINSGRSLDCLPQGLYPTKMIGNDFIRFVDNNYSMKSSQLVRFMDDFYLFSDNLDDLRSDFIFIQKLVGAKGLSVNPKKTIENALGHIDVDSEILSIKTDLLKKRRMLINIEYDEFDNEIVRKTLLKHPLSKKEVNYLYSIIEKDNLEEDDAELILTIMRDHTERVEKRLPYIITNFPNLAKNVHSFCSAIDDKSMIAAMLLNELRKPKSLIEFQIFWFAYMLEDYLMNLPETSGLIEALMNHPSATPITRAKVLEVPDLRFGLPEMRSTHLSMGTSDWMSWASAVGSRNLQPASRNHTLKYFGNASQLNHLIANIVLKKT